MVSWSSGKVVVVVVVKGDSMMIYLFILILFLFYFLFGGDIKYIFINKYIDDGFIIIIYRLMKIISWKTL